MINKLYMKNYSGAALLTSAFTSMVMAQSKLLAKTTWKIENIATDGNIVLKTKHINLLAEEPKFNYLQFTDTKNIKPVTLVSKRMQAIVCMKKVTSLNFIPVFRLHLIVEPKILKVHMLTK